MTEYTYYALGANGKNEGLQLMHFNTEYWDKTLLPSAIQFMTFGYHQMNQEETEERFRNNGHPNYPALLMNSFDQAKLQSLIQK